MVTLLLAFNFDWFENTEGVGETAKLRPVVVTPLLVGGTTPLLSLATLNFFITAKFVVAVVWSISSLLLFIVVESFVSMATSV